MSADTVDTFEFVDQRAATDSESPYPSFTVDDLSLVDGIDARWLDSGVASTFLVECEEEERPRKKIKPCHPVHALNDNAFEAKLSTQQLQVYRAMKQLLTNRTARHSYIFVDGKSGCGKSMLLKRFLIESVRARRLVYCFGHKLNNINAIARSINKIVTTIADTSMFDDVKRGSFDLGHVRFSSVQRVFYSLGGGDNTAIQRVETPEATLFSVLVTFLDTFKPSLDKLKAALAQTNRQRPLSIAIDEYALVHPSTLTLLIMLIVHFFRECDVVFFLCGSVDQLTPIGAAKYEPLNETSRGAPFTEYEMNRLHSTDTPMGVVDRNAWVGSLHFSNVLRTIGRPADRTLWTFRLTESFRIESVNIDDPLRQLISKWPTDTYDEEAQAAAVQFYVSVKTATSDVRIDATHIFDAYADAVGASALDSFELDVKIIVARNRDCYRLLVRFGMALYNALIARGVARSVVDDCIVRTRAAPYMLIVGMRYSLTATVFKPELINGTTLKLRPFD